MSDLRNLRPISLNAADMLQFQRPQSITGQLEGAQISRLRYLADLGMFGGTQFLLELRDHRIAIFMAAPAPRDALGQPKVGPYAWYLAVHMMEKRLIVPKSIEARMGSDRLAMGEEPPDAIQKRVEGATILRVVDSPHPVPPHESKGLKLELDNRVDVYVYAVPPANPRSGIQAEFVIETREGDRLISTGRG